MTLRVDFNIIDIMYCSTTDCDSKLKHKLKHILINSLQVMCVDHRRQDLTLPFNNNSGPIKAGLISVKLFQIAYATATPFYIRSSNKANIND
jgi:hypothetical protein